MAETRPALVAHSRTITGKAVRHLRATGILPAVVYGHGVASEALQIDARAFDELSRRTSRNVLVDLTVDGSRPRRVLVYGVQRHPVTRRPLHVDLLAVRMTEELTVDVPLHFSGVAPAVDKLGGTLFHAVDAVRVRALPDQLPSSINVDVSGLESFDDAVHGRELAIPDGVTLLTDVDDVVAKVLPPRVVEEEVPVEEVEVGAEEAAAEAEEAAAEGEPGEKGAAGEAAIEGKGQGRT